MRVYYSAPDELVYFAECTLCCKPYSRVLLSGQALVDDTFLMQLEWTGEDCDDARCAAEQRVSHHDDGSFKCDISLAVCIACSAH
jgi:hypothetical protein